MSITVVRSCRRRGAKATGTGVAAEWGTHFRTGREFTPVPLGSQWSAVGCGGYWWKKWQLIILDTVIPSDYVLVVSDILMMCHDLSDDLYIDSSMIRVHHKWSFCGLIPDFLGTLFFSLTYSWGFKHHCWYSLMVAWSGMFHGIRALHFKHVRKADLLVAPFWGWHGWL